MAGFVYLVRIGDLYMIGSTANLEKRIKQLKPDEILKSIKATDEHGLEARLLRRYKNQRIPETAYFRFDKDQLSDCLKQFGVKGHVPLTTKAELAISLNFALIIALVVLFSSLFLGMSLDQSFAIALGTGSLPMWVLFILGNFGGYEVKDMPLLSTWPNRIKSLLLAASLSYASYLTISFF